VLAYIHREWAGALRKLGDDAAEKDSIIHYRRALAIEPSSASTLYRLGLTLNKLGRIQDAQVAFQEARDIYTDSPKVPLKALSRVELALANIFLDRKNYSKAASIAMSVAMRPTDNILTNRAATLAYDAANKSGDKCSINRIRQYFPKNFKVIL
jgi:tetratricopeptide (TPR) repeat protein